METKRERERVLRGRHFYIAAKTNKRTLRQSGTFKRREKILRRGCACGRTRGRAAFAAFTLDNGEEASLLEGEETEKLGFDELLS